ncbi:hypothetical protein COB57_04655 [Candidatus Peregrinibacteria bacterium]|nr:MAG: hypothetical protein COB57_04655 [Candidatus Peregrinibacteria bacterium]
MPVRFRPGAPIENKKNLFAEILFLLFEKSFHICYNKPNFKKIYVNQVDKILLALEKEKKVSSSDEAKVLRLFLENMDIKQLEVFYDMLVYRELSSLKTNK